MRYLGDPHCPHPYLNRASAKLGFFDEPNMKNLYNSIAQWFMKTALYNWWVEDVNWRIRFSTKYTSFNGRKYHSGYEKLKKGHLILTCDPAKLTSKQIPGDWDHLAFCRGKRPDVDYEIGEMTNEGYTRVDFFDLCHQSQRIVILQVDGWDSVYVDQMVACLDEILSVADIFYDKQFDIDVITREKIDSLKKFGIKARLNWYCTELARQIDFKRILKHKTSELVGKPFITPDDVFNAENVKIVWDSDWVR